MMKREFALKLGNVEYPLVVEGDTITVNGRPFTVEFADDGMVLVDGIAYDVALEGETATVGGESYEIQVSGLAVTHLVPSPDPSGVVTAPRAAEAGAGAVLAIMPGKIVRVLVEPGQQVEEGSPVCVLEAMKMENELRARQTGTVRVVHVKPGDDVEKDQVLIEIE
jgi:biotin carboxyl carrier protein